MADGSQSDTEVRRSKIADFDEQVWTVTAVVLILAGCIAGLVIAQSDFAEPRLLYNGWVHLASVGLLVGLLFAGLAVLKGSLRRRFQLGILISVLLHLIIALFLQGQYLKLPELRENVAGRNPADDESERPANFRWTAPEEREVIEDELVYDEPLETVPSDATAAASIDGPAAALREPNRELLTGGVAPPVPEQAILPHPGLPDLARAELSAPRRAETVAAGPLHRQEFKHLPQPGEPIPEPNAPVSAGVAEGMLDAQVAALGRLESSGATFERRTFDAPESQHHDPVIGLTRQGNREEQLAEKPATPAPSRQIVNPADIARSEALAPQATSAGKGPETAGPTVTVAARREQSAVAGRAEIAQPPLAPATQDSPKIALRDPARDRATAAATAVRVAASPLLPRASSAARGAPAETTVESIASRNAGSPAQDRPAATVPSRAQQVPRIAAAEAGRGQAVAPMTHANTLPAVAAKRATGQRESAETSAAPASTPQTLNRSSRGIAMPSTILPVLEDTSVAAAAMGGSLPSGVEAISKTTAVTRSAEHQPPLGNKTAAAGGAEFAVGSAAILARRGVPQGSGLADPSVVSDSTATRIAKTPAVALLAAGGEATTPVDEPVAGTHAAATSGGFTAPSAGTAVKSHQHGGRTELTGLAGPLGDEPMAGAVESMTNLGRPLPAAMARRAAPSQNEGGGQDGAPNVSATIAKSNGGGLTPAMAAPSEPVGLPGAGGLAIAQGGMTSKLDAGSYASVERRAGSGVLGKAATPAGIVEAGIGAQESVVLAGPTRVGGTGLPVALSGTKGVSVERAASGVLKGGTIADGLQQPEAMASGVAAASGVTGSRAGIASVAVAPIDTSVGRGAVSTGDVSDMLAGRAGAVSGVSTSRGLSAVVGGPQTGARRHVDSLVTTAQDAAMTAERGTSLQRSTLGGPLSEVMAEGFGTSGNAQDAPAGKAAVAGAETDQPGTSTVAGPARQATGLPALENGLTHLEGPLVSGPAATTPGLATGPRRLPRAMESGPPIAAAIGGGPLGKTDAPGLLRGLTETIEPLPVGDTAAAQAGTGRDATIGSGVGQLRHQEGGLPVLVSAPPGPSGLGGTSSHDLGIPSRLARAESDVVHTVARRFVIERSGGGVSIDGSAREATAPYEQRDPRLRRQSIEAHGGDGHTERAVEVGVDFFARIQFPDGHWSLNKLPPGVTGEDPALGSMDADTAATGLALLTYLGAGYTHLDDKHREIVRHGVDWLVRNQKPTGELFTGGSKYTRFYSHGIAAIALCEAYGMTQDPELREPARKAIDFILKSQHPKLGGWRYDTDPKTGKATETDTSVTGWQLMALKSAQMAGLEVPSDALSKVGGWLDLAQAENGKSIYNPYADKRRAEQLEGLKPSLAMTAEAMLMRLYVGQQRTDARLIAGAEFLKNNLPRLGTDKAPQRDCYYWYYATQTMFQMQGDYWAAWNDGMRVVLQSNQAEKGVWAGSWHPNKPVRDRWGEAGGRVYITAMHLLMLEVYYRHLPLYQELSK